MRKLLYIIITILISLPLPVRAQEKLQDNASRSHIRAGNREFHSNNQDSPAKSELHYRKAMAANPRNAQAIYNLGDALLAQNKDSLAYSMFEKASQLEPSKERRARSFHNMGVIMERQQQYSQAIECYKQALRLTPHDNLTRYNMVLCMRLQKNNPKQNNQNNQNNKNNKNNNDKNQDKNNQNKNNQDKNNQNKNDQNKDNQQDKQKQQPQPQQMSKENAEQLLQAAMQNEKSTQQRLKKAMSQPRRKNLQKNW